MKKIITIQHTQSIHHTNGMVGSWTDWELSEQGIEQANRIGKKLKEELAGKSFVMYSSDLLRAKQTAENVGKHLNLTPVLRKELRERNLGRCCGKSVQWMKENKEMYELIFSRLTALEKENKELKERVTVLEGEKVK